MPRRPKSGRKPGLDDDPLPQESSAEKAAEREAAAASSPRKPKPQKPKEPAAPAAPAAADGAKGGKAPADGGKAPGKDAPGGDGKKAAAQADDDAVFLQRASELRDEGNRHYETAAYKSALTCYEQAIALTPKSHPDRAASHANRAACFLMQRQYLEVVRETSAALELVPGYGKALLRRAKAYEAIGQGGQAERDAKALLARPDAKGEHADAQALLDRLKPKDAGPAGLGGMGLGSGKKKGGGGGAAAPKEQAKAPAKAPPQPPPQPKAPPTVRGKVSLGGDMRVVLLAEAMTLSTAVQAVRRRFHEETGPLALSHEGKAVASDEQLRAVLASALEKAPPNGQPPALYLTLERTEPPKPPPRQAEPGTIASLENENGELDEWVLDFASLFREHLGVDAETHAQKHGEGLELCSEALEPTTSGTRAGEMLDTAAKRFQEAAAFAVFNWGNVHLCAARKRMEAGKPKGGEKTSEPPEKLTKDAAAFIEGALAEADAKFDRALQVQHDMHDARIAKAQKTYETARLLCADVGTSKADRDRQAEDAFVRADTMFGEVFRSLPDEEPRPPPPEPKEDGEQEEDPSLKAQVLVMWGNELYEHSQFRSRRGKEWQALLDRAVEKFAEAGCAQADVDNALAAHVGRKAAAAC